MTLERTPRANHRRDARSIHSPACAAYLALIALGADCEADTKQVRGLTVSDIEVPFISHRAEGLLCIPAPVARGSDADRARLLFVISGHAASPCSITSVRGHSKIHAMKAALHAARCTQANVKRRNCRRGIGPIRDAEMRRPCSPCGHTLIWPQEHRSQPRSQVQGLAGAGNAEKRRRSLVLPRPMRSVHERRHLRSTTH